MPRTEGGVILCFLTAIFNINQKGKKHLSVHKPSHIFLFIPRQADRG